LRAKKPNQKSIFRVAELSDCSISTVSNVLNNKGRFSKATRDAVLKAVKKLKYHPNSAGRSLRLQRTETLGLLFYPSCAEIFRNPFYAEVMEGLEATLLKAGYYLLLAGYDAASSDAEVPGFLRQGKVDGLIFLGRFPSEIIRRFSKFDTPLVLLDSNVEWPVDSVFSDGFSAEVNVVAHLHELGHRRILFLAYNHEDSNIDLRVQGFLAGLRQMGLPGDKKSVIREFMSHDDIYSALRKRLDGPNPPTAVIAVNDTLAMDMMSRLASDGIRVPEQLSIVGYDDHEGSAKCSPSLSTVRVNKVQLGQVGAEMVMNRIKSPDSPVVKSTLPTEFVARGSVEAAPK
jgi:LacI family transcriptional regulator